MTFEGHIDLGHPFIELTHRVASGAMGEVFRAHHRGIGKDVAIKLLNASLTDEPALRRRFRAEARAAAKVESPHVVRHFDYGTAPDGHPFIVMEWCEGVTLRDLMEERGPFAPAQVEMILRQLAAALDAVHAEGLVHRDVKPENVLLVPTDDELRVKLVDFGVTLDINASDRRMTAPGSLVGTPAYMSREQVVDNHADHRSDVWALGVVGYEMLTGCAPFDGRTVGVICAEVVDNDPLPISQRLPDRSRAFDAWFAKATANEPDRRHQSAGELLAEFRRACRNDRRTERRRTTESRPRSTRERRVEGHAHVSSLSPSIVSNGDEAKHSAEPKKARWLAVAALVAGLGALTLTTADQRRQAWTTARAHGAEATRAVLLEERAQHGIADRANTMALSALAAHLPR